MATIDVLVQFTIKAKKQSRYDGQQPPASDFVVPMKLTLKPNSSSTPTEEFSKRRFSLGQVNLSDDPIKSPEGIKGWFNTLAEPLSAVVNRGPYRVQSGIHLSVRRGSDLPHLAKGHGIAGLWVRPFVLEVIQTYLRADEPWAGLSLPEYIEFMAGDRSAQENPQHHRPSTEPAVA